MKIKAILVILAMLLLGLTVSAQQSLLPVFEFKTDTTHSWIVDSSYLEFLSDKNGQLSIDSILQFPASVLFADYTQSEKIRKLASKTFWFHYRIRNTLSYPLTIGLTSVAFQADFFLVDSTGRITRLKTGEGYPLNMKDGLKKKNESPYLIPPNQTIEVYFRRHSTFESLPPLRMQINNYNKTAIATLQSYENDYFSGEFFKDPFFSGIFLLSAVFNLFFFFVTREKVYLYFSLFLFVISTSELFVWEVASRGILWMQTFLRNDYLIAIFFLVHFVRRYFNTNVLFPKWDKIIQVSALLLLVDLALYFVPGLNRQQSGGSLAALINVLVLVITFFIVRKKSGSNWKFFFWAVAPFVICMTVALLLYLIIDWLNYEYILESEAIQGFANKIDWIFQLMLVWTVVAFSWTLFSKYNLQRKEIARQELEKEKLATEREIEKNAMIIAQKEELELQVEQRTQDLKKSLEDLKAAQKQLVQKEKMASLGELTAGIAHEIQNPLNFVNNFSEVSGEMIVEAEGSRQRAGENSPEVGELLTDIKQNLEKINHHGKRADAIVKGMLQHSRNSTGEKEPTDLNALADEYLRLSYHGVLSKDNSFNATINTDFDPSVGKVNLIPQDIGRVLLNLYNNAFYAVNQKQKEQEKEEKNEKQKQKTETGESTFANALPGEAGTADKYQPEVSVSTKRKGNQVEITVKDNGNGIPQKIVDKIFQPFFTTKPTGQGTGLGLSLSYDIIKAHGGEIKVSTIDSEGSEFLVTLNANS